MVYHGVLAPHARWRRAAVAYEGLGVSETRAPDTAGPGAPELESEALGKPRYRAWADLMRRAFELDVLNCPRCGGRMRLIATIQDPRVIRQILAHLGLPTEIPQPRPPPPPAAALFADIPA